MQYFGGSPDRWFVRACRATPPKSRAPDQSQPASGPLGQAPWETARTCRHRVPRLAHLRKPVRAPARAVLLQPKLLGPLAFPAMHLRYLGGRLGVSHPDSQAYGDPEKLTHFAPSGPSLAESVSVWDHNGSALSHAYDVGAGGLCRISRLITKSRPSTSSRNGIFDLEGRHHLDL